MRQGLLSTICWCATLAFAVGCVSKRPSTVANGVGEGRDDFPASLSPSVQDSRGHQIDQVQFEDNGGDATSKVSLASNVEKVQPDEDAADSQLMALEQEALESNAQLTRLYREAQAAAARSRHIDKLPDPRVGANIFGNPLETAAGSQRANMMVSQAIPWLARLDAAQQQACLEALAARADYAAARLRVISGVRTNWYRLYVIDKQIGVAESNQQLLEALIEVANARLSTGNATQGDVLLGTLELAQLEERLILLRRQRRSVTAELNRLVGRQASAEIASPQEIDPPVPNVDADSLLQIATTSQPEFESARLLTAATRWGVEVARLSRRPELAVSASYFFTDDNRPPSNVVDVGEDPWALGVQVSLPLWHAKYDAMRQEAAWKHQASHATEEQLHDRYDAIIVDLLSEAQRAFETAELYEASILPQARQTLAADQDAYSTGNVEFDRVIRDYRNLLTLELGYHQALGDLAIANARLFQVVGADLSFSSPRLPDGVVGGLPTFAGEVE